MRFFYEIYVAGLSIIAVSTLAPRRRLERALYCDARDCLTLAVVALHIQHSGATATVSRQKSTQSCYNIKLWHFMNRSRVQMKWSSYLPMIWVILYRQVTHMRIKFFQRLNGFINVGQMIWWAQMRYIRTDVIRIPHSGTWQLKQILHIRILQRTPFWIVALSFLWYIQRNTVVSVFGAILKWSIQIVTFLPSNKFRNITYFLVFTRNFVVALVPGHINRVSLSAKRKALREKQENVQPTSIVLKGTISSWNVNTCQVNITRDYLSWYELEMSNDNISHEICKRFAWFCPG